MTAPSEHESKLGFLVLALIAGTFLAVVGKSFPIVGRCNVVACFEKQTEGKSLQEPLQDFWVNVHHRGSSTILASVDAISGTADIQLRLGNYDLEVCSVGFDCKSSPVDLGPDQRTYPFILNVELKPIPRFAEVQMTLTAMPTSEPTKPVRPSSVEAETQIPTATLAPAFIPPTPTVSEPYPNATEPPISLPTQAPPTYTSTPSPSPTPTLVPTAPLKYPEPKIAAAFANREFVGEQVRLEWTWDKSLKDEEVFCVKLRKESESEEKTEGWSRITNLQFRPQQGEGAYTWFVTVVQKPVLGAKQLSPPSNQGRFVYRKPHRDDPPDPSVTPSSIPTWTDTPERPTDPPPTRKPTSETPPPPTRKPTSTPKTHPGDEETSVPSMWIW